MSPIIFLSQGFGELRFSYSEILTELMMSSNTGLYI